MPLRVWFYVAMVRSSDTGLAEGQLRLDRCGALAPRRMLLTVVQFNITYHINLGGRSLHRQVIRTLIAAQSKTELFTEPACPQGVFADTKRLAENYRKSA